ncbi:YutD-like domain-containing protein [Carnobacterium maltaromaticum]|uniref:YutD family protein n=1 Tax=Carnobacterium maltaromaticum TaxID=2751 RepID=UPI00026C8C95
MSDEKEVEVIQESSTAKEQDTTELTTVEATELTVEEENLVVRMIDETNLIVEGRKYELVLNYRDGFNSEKLAERYSDILSKYDFIVADWGFDQLRLKGFYEDKNRKVPQEQRIGSLEDYLYEFCNFGCAYFVLKRTGGRKEKTVRPKRTRTKNTQISATKAESTKPTREVATKSQKTARPTKQRSDKSRSDNQKNKNKSFVAKQVKEKSEAPVVSKPAVETVKEKNGQRHFNIRRNDVEKVKNKE